MSCLPYNLREPCCDSVVLLHLRDGTVYKTIHPGESFFLFAKVQLDLLERNKKQVDLEKQQQQLIIEMFYVVVHS